MRSNTIKTVSSPIIHHSLFPHSLSICLSNFSQRACQRNWTRQLSNPPAMSEDGRWSPPFFFLSPPTLHSFSLGSKLLSSSLSFFVLFCPNKGRRGGSELSSPAGFGEQLAHVITQERDDHEGGYRPLLCSQWHLHSLSMCNTISHAALSFTINLYWSYL